MFVHLPGASLEQAFKVGKRISEYISSTSPAPVLLKFEKVHSFCRIPLLESSLWSFFVQNSRRSNFLQWLCFMSAFQNRIITLCLGSIPPLPLAIITRQVYLPCVLQTKKRYVGYSFEHLEQREPVFDAKGIETVRRDGCPAVAKMLEKSIRLLFETKDLSVIRAYLHDQVCSAKRDRFLLRLCLICCSGRKCTKVDLI
jgi:DNA polymerase elongation subunit (family B)